MSADTDGFGPADLDVSRETSDRLSRYVDLLRDRAQRLNLVGRNELGAIWRRHVFDSLQIWPMIGSDATVVDLGSGAGFPGLVTAICQKEAGGTSKLIESTGKKCAFLRDVGTELDLPCRVQQARIEEVVRPEPSVTCVTARALAPLDRLLGYAEPWMRNGARGLFFKGRNWRDELTNAQECWTIRYEALPNANGGEGVILDISEACFHG